MMTETGQKLPNVALLNSNGDAVNLAQLAFPCVLYAYPKADTPGCTKEGQGFSALSADFAKLGVNIYGISKDKPTKLAKFIEKYGLTVQLLSDEASDACEQLGIWVEKSMYGKSYMGIQRDSFLIDKNGVVSEIWRKVKVAGHAEAVLESAKKLG
jgi:thioredoxin-dependent peroxiredoxin